MSSPGQRRGSCGHAMAGFDSHSKCARCRDKGLGDDPCVQKKECAICRGFNPEQIQQLSTPTYKDRKDKKATASSSAPTLVDPAHVSVLGKVEKVKAVHSTLLPRRRSVVNHLSLLPVRRNLPAVNHQLKICSIWMRTGLKDSPVLRQCCWPRLSQYRLNRL